MDQNLKKYTEEVYEETQKIIDLFGSRLAGTKNALDAGDYIYDSINEFADEAHKEEFHVYQGAFLGWIRILVFNYLLALVFLWLDYAFVSFILLIVSVLVLVLQFFLYKPLLDYFYPKKKGKNVYGTIEPKKEVKQQIIVSGHHDSARIFNFFIKQPKLYNLRTTGSIALVIILALVSLVFLITPWLDSISLYVKILFSISFLLVGQMWFFASKKGTPGAGDNLVASMIALEIGKHFKLVEPLEHTRIIVLSFDAEEEGLRGARAYVKAHEKELKDIPTYLLNADCLYDEKELFFLTSDLNNFVKFDDAFTDELLDISEAEGVFTFKQPLAFLTGGTDAAEFAKRGITSTTLIGMPWSNSNRNTSYHTPNDTLEHVNFNVVHDTMKIFMGYIRYKDKKVGAPVEGN
jgi:hypothetical protein